MSRKSELAPSVPTFVDKATLVRQMADRSYLKSDLCFALHLCVNARRSASALCVHAGAGIALIAWLKSRCSGTPIFGLGHIHAVISAAVV